MRGTRTATTANDPLTLLHVGPRLLLRRLSGKNHHLLAWTGLLSYGTTSTSMQCNQAEALRWQVVCKVVAPMVPGRGTFCSWLGKKPSLAGSTVKAVKRLNFFGAQTGMGRMQIYTYSIRFKL